MRPQLFHALCSLAAELAPPSGRAVAAIFDCSEVGLILHLDERSTGYWITPQNADTFASTGGDGVHFSLLQVPGRQPERFPVVMTVPMSRRANHIVGESLHEFLCLGCVYGYFSLEQLAYDRDRTIDELEAGRHAYLSTSDQKLYLPTLRSRLNLQPWHRVRERLDELQRTWKPALVLSEAGLDVAGEWDRPAT